MVCFFSGSRVQSPGVCSLWNFARRGETFFLELYTIYINNYVFSGIKGKYSAMRSILYFFLTIFGLETTCIKPIQDYSNKIYASNSPIRTFSTLIFSVLLIDSSEWSCIQLGWTRDTDSGHTSLAPPWCTAKWGMLIIFAWGKVGHSTIENIYNWKQNF